MKFKRLEINRKNVYLLIFVCIYLSFLISNIRNYNYSKYILSFTIAFNLLLIYKTRKSQPLIIFSVFILTYTTNLIPYFFYESKIVYFDAFSDYVSFSRALNVHSLFIVALSFFTDWDINKENNAIATNLPKGNNIIISLISLLIIIFITINGRSGNNIFEGGYTLNTANKIGLSIGEYIYIFFIIFYIFSKKSKKIILLLSSIYILKIFMFGARIEALQLIILIFVLLFENKIDNKKVYIFLILGIILMNIIGDLRVEDGKISFKEIFNNSIKVEKYGYIRSNQSNVFHSSSVYINLVDNEVWDNEFKKVSLKNFILRIYKPTKSVKEEGILSNYAGYFQRIGGGGLISSYFYVWFGYGGVIAIALYVAFIINKLYRIKNKYILVYAIMTIVTFPRWFAYDPITLFKLCMYVIPVYLICNIFNRIIKYKQ